MFQSRQRELVNGVLSAGIGRAVVARCGVWPTLLSAVLLAGQQTPQPPTPSAATGKDSSTATNKSAEKAASVEKAAPAPSPPSGTSSAAPNAAAVAGQSGSPAKAGADAPPKVIPFEYAPYRIHVWVAAAPSPDLDEQVVARIRNDLTQRIDIAVGAPWSATVSAPPESLYYTVAMCPRLLTDKSIGAANKDLLKDDKLIVVSLSASPREWRVWTRELDLHTRTWGPIVDRSERQLAGLARSVFDTILAAYAPLARIEDGQGKACVVRGRATGLITLPDSPAMIVKGDVLQPIFRQNDRYGNPIPGRTEPLPFTFLHVTAPDPLSPHLLNCNVHSGMRSPIHGRSVSTSRRERWAIKVRPRFSSTELFVESRPVRRNEAKIPLSGVEVFAKPTEPEVPKELTPDEQKEAENKNPAELLGVTDWRGSLSLKPGGTQLQILYLRNGGLLLARLPIVPGLDERLLAQVPDDNPRLQAEGFVRGLNSEVTDLVVQRQLIAMRMRKKIKEYKLDEAEKLFDEFRGLKTLNDLQQMINIQLQRQKPTSSPAVKTKIDKLYADERELLAKYIDADLQVKLLAELSQARASPPPDPENPEPPSEQKADTEKKKLPAAVQAKGGETASK